MMTKQIKGIINRVFAILPMYEEKHRSDVIIRKLVSMVSDLEAIAFYIKDVNLVYAEKVQECITILRCIYCDVDDIYNVSHAILRKNILDVCGLLKRIVEELGDS